MKYIIKCPELDKYIVVNGYEYHWTPHKYKATRWRDKDIAMQYAVLCIQMHNKDDIYRLVVVEIK